MIRMHLVTSAAAPKVLRGVGLLCRRAIARDGSPLGRRAGGAAGAIGVYRG